MSKYKLILYLFHLGEWGPWELTYDNYKSCHRVEHRIEAMFEHGPVLEWPMNLEKVLIREIFDEGKGRTGILFIPCSIYNK